MTVVLLDPARPDQVPAAAVALLAQTVAVTEDVHPQLLWQLPSYELVALVGDDGTKTLVSTDREHPAVQARLARAEMVVEGETVPGAKLVKAVELMDRLRRSGPWERRQTHDSLRRYLLEEVYELLDSIDHGSPGELKSELGDLLLQVLFHARIAADASTGSFDIDDVAQSFIDKISYRTPGVLGGEHSDLERQINEWEAAKAAEREQGSVLDGIVTTQPALGLVQKLFERLAGADFPVAAISPSLYRVDVPFRKHASTSVEDDLRRRAMTLMDDVRIAENEAKADGVLLRDENTWRKYLGMAYTEDVPQILVDAPLEEEYVSVDDDSDDEDVEDTLDADDYEEVAVDSDPIASGTKAGKNKVKGVKVRKNVPGIVVQEKWSAAEGE